MRDRRPSLPSPQPEAAPGQARCAADEGSGGASRCCPVLLAGSLWIRGGGPSWSGATGPRRKVAWARARVTDLGRAGGAVTAGDGCGARWLRGTRIRSEGIFLFNLLSPSSQIRSPAASGHRSRVSSRGGGWERGPEKSVAGYAGLPAATPMGAEGWKGRYRGSELTPKF